MTRGKTDAIDTSESGWAFCVFRLFLVERRNRYPIYSRTAGRELPHKVYFCQLPVIVNDTHCSLVGY